MVAVFPRDLIEVARSSIDERSHVELAQGGATRQESVAAGLQLVKRARVVVHDAARPFVSIDDIERTLRALDDADAAIAAVPVDETLKSVDSNRVLGTIDRSRLWRAQTPQAFRTEVLRRAHNKGVAEKFLATDDAQLIERYGGSVVVVRGRSDNIKLTYPEDFVMAEQRMRGSS